MITIYRSEKVLGLAGGRQKGASIAMSTTPDPKDVLIFLDPYAAVSDNWIAPLYQTLFDHPKSSKFSLLFLLSFLICRIMLISSQIVVYPAIDVLDIEAERIIQGSNVVGAFDWGLSFRWEVY